MNGQIKIDIDASRALNFLSRFSRRAQANADRAKDDAAKKVYNSAKRYAPVDTGALRNNIVIDRSGKSISVRSKIYYSEFVIGKRYRRGPYRGEIIDYMNKALEENRDDIQREMRKAVKRAIGFGI